MASRAEKCRRFSGLILCRLETSEVAGVKSVFQLRSVSTNYVGRAGHVCAFLASDKDFIHAVIREFGAAFYHVRNFVSIFVRRCRLYCWRDRPYTTRLTLKA